MCCTLKVENFIPLRSFRCRFAIEAREVLFREENPFSCLSNRLLLTTSVGLVTISVHSEGSHVECWQTLSSLF
jgi:hypothetical protein